MNKSIRHSLGFSLIEVMIVVLILGILATVAYPSYSESVRQSRRVDGMNNLLRYQIMQEQYRARNPGYATNFTALLGSGGATINSSEGYYSLSIVTTAATIGSQFEIHAAPIGTQSTDTCNTFVVDQSGPDYTSPNANARCWNQ